MSGIDAVALAIATLQQPYQDKSHNIDSRKVTMMKLRIGVTGLRRGRTWINTFSQDDRSDVIALCDIDPSLLKEFPATQKVTDFGDLLAMDLDAVVICTPPAYHAEQTVLALESGKHVLCEVPATTTISECRQIVNAVNKSGQKYMLAENSCYSDMHLTWKSTVEDGNLGKIIYAEAEYIHDCRQLMKNDDGTLTWRASWPPIQYCTHSLGPLLFIADDRCVSAIGLSSGSNVAPDIGAIDMEVGLFRTANGTTIKILCGFSIERHPAFHWYIIYGTSGVLESQRQYGDVADANKPISGYYQATKSDRNMKLRQSSAAAHGIAENRVASEFIESILNDTTPSIDVYRAMDYTVPGICAHLSAQKGGEPISVPDLRTN